MMIKYLYPLISCICITSERPQSLLKAITYYDAQNYPNKELVVSYPKGDIATKELLEKLATVPHLKILAIERAVEMSIGASRNAAIAKCNGTYICTWDDDDFHREVRLMYQYTCLNSVKQKREASILPHVVLYDIVKDSAFYSDSFNWPGTLLCQKELALQHPYLDRNIGEAAQLLSYLINSKYLHYFDNYNLYSFVYHGHNLSGEDQFRKHSKNRPALDLQSTRWLGNLMKSDVQLI